MSDKKPDAYSALADWFEYLNDDCGYNEWSQYLLKKIKSLVSERAKGLDIGCGSGYFTRALKRAGFDMTGMDVSKEMLVKAQALSGEEGISVPYLLGDITSFRTPEKYDFAVAVNDCFNYVKKDKILSAFKRVRACLGEGGFFLFDISSEKKLREKVVGVPDIDDRDDVTYFSFNTLDGDEVTMDVSLFVRQKDNLFRRFDERHLLYIYRIEEIQAALTAAGFELLSVCGHLGDDISDSDRIEFVCKRK